MEGATEGRNPFLMRLASASYLCNVRREHGIVDPRTAECNMVEPVMKELLATERPAATGACAKAPVPGSMADVQPSLACLPVGGL